MPDEQEKTSAAVERLGEKIYEPSDMAKDEIYDLINQVFHDAAAAWQFFDQGDSEEGLTMLGSIRSRCDEIEAVLEECRIGGKEAA